MKNNSQLPADARIELSAGRDIFGKDAAGYHTARLGYPTELFDCLFRRVSMVAHPAILEIGAGTGLATRDLLAHAPNLMTVIEPNAQMAEFLRDALGDPAVLTIRNCPFESADLPPDSFDLVAAAASFHWLEPVSALAKIRAALKTGGVLALWWNVYRAIGIGDEFADALAPALEGIALPPSEGTHTHHSLDTDRYRNLLEANGFGKVEHAIFRRERVLGAAEMRALYASYSFVRLLPDRERLGLLDTIGALVETRFGGQAPNIVLTPLYMATKSNRS